MPTRRAVALALATTFGSKFVAPANAGTTAPALTFPRDYGAHPDSRIEWWYVTGALEAAARVWGFQITFFRAATGLGGAEASRFEASQLVFAHAAVTDFKQARLRHDQRIARRGFGIAETSSDDTALLLRGWRLDREAASGPGRYRAIATSETGGFRLDLVLEATQALLLQGAAGVSQKGPRTEQSSRYYSEPQLAVHGTLGLDRAPTLAVTGRAWLDHEWSDTLLDAGAVGWDWIGMNLDDGSALMAFRVRRADGTTLWAGGSHRAPDAEARIFGAGEVAFSAGRRWASPATKAVYPVEWSLDTPVGRFAIKALLDDQELDSRASTGAIYWEGLSQLHDADGKSIGRGYLEMTGYAGRLRL